MRKIRLAVIMLLMFTCICGYSQNISIESFTHAQTDLTANTKGSIVYDQNGNVCALIKVETTFDNFTFDVGTLGVSETKRVGGELWVYVPFGIRKITISHPQFGVVRDYQIPFAIEKGRTYILRLKTASANRTYDSSRKQKVHFEVFPANSTVEINGISLPVSSNGVCEQEFAFGIYEAVISSPKYHSKHMQIEVNNPDTPHIHIVRLDQAFGWLKIFGNGDETLKIDGSPVEFTPGKPIEVMSGRHQIALAKPLHKSHETSIEIKDGEELAYAPVFEANYSELEFRVDTPSEIWVDGKKVATSDRWTGKLEYGQHTIECKKESHRTTRKIFEASPITSPPLYTGGPIMLDSPQPIYGTIIVTSTPSDSEVYVDGNPAGTTPATVKVLIGQRKVSVQRKGYTQFEKVINVVESTTHPVSAELTNIVSVKINSAPNGAALFINGQRNITNNTASVTPWLGSLSSGTYNVTIRKSGYHDLNRNITVDPAHHDFFFVMKKQLYHRNNFVLGASASTNLSSFSIGGYVGGYISNIYIEGNYKYGLSKSEIISWYESTGEKLPAMYTYRPMEAGGKVGYGFIIGSNFRITPHVGLTGTILKGTCIRESDYEFNPDKCSSMALNGGVKFSCALASCLELNITPEYYMSVQQTDIYKELYAISPIIRSWSEGLRINIGFGIKL